MIYDVVTTTTFKDGKSYVEEDSVEAPNILAAIVFTADMQGDDMPYKPPRKGDDEGTITVTARAVTNNKPAYRLRKAAVWDGDKYLMITDWNPIY